MTSRAQWCTKPRGTESAYRLGNGVAKVDIGRVLEHLLAAGAGRAGHKNDISDGGGSTSARDGDAAPPASVRGAVQRSTAGLLADIQPASLTRAMADVR